MKLVCSKMTPVCFDACVGWLHTPPDHAGGGVAVVICQGLMRDGLLAYCSFRLLGDELAAAGYWALRFDYPGTGDSLDGSAASAGHWTAFQQSIDRACDWLRRASGATTVILVGLRAGATLAALAASRRDDVAGLVLFEPVVSGRSWVRQLILEADLQSDKTSARGEDLDIREFHFSAATLDEVTQVDLRKVKLKPRQKVALFAQPEARGIDECMKAWNESGAEATSHAWDGLVPLMRHNVIDENALADFTNVHAWLKDTLPAQPLPPRALPAEARILPEGAVETPLWFGRRLFGMLSRPATGHTDQILLIGNGGRDPHYGAARQNVDFARHLARHGIACLRFDFAGLGDSVGPPGKENLLTHTFSDRLPDIRAALDQLQKLGFRRFAMLGLCSGAYHAYHAALIDARLTDLLLVNLPLFILPTGDVLDFLENRGQSAAVVARKLLSPGSWRTLLSGRSDVRTLLRSVTNHARRQVVGRSQALGRRLGLIREQSFPVRSMTALSRRGARVLFLFSPGDEEKDAFSREFGLDGEGLAPFKGSKMTVLERMDHDLTRAVGRRDAEKAVVDFLTAGRS
jgi:alpha-beta hydrolase superfamily lysophospholipase